jgi:starch-binding outer membrane protein, SusD/RagB family
MKTLIPGIFIFISLATLNSCVEENENTPDNNPVIDTVYHGTVSDLTKDLDTVYMYLRTKQFDNGLCSPFLLSNMMSDQATCGGGGANDLSPFQEIAVFQATPENPSSHQLWLKYFYGIHYCNKILFNTSLDSYESKEGLIAETRFLRACLQFEMLKFYGNIPVLDKYVDLGDTAEFTQNVISKSFTSIVNDLKASLTGLPSKQMLSGDDYFRPTKGAALALLGKVHLYMASPFYNQGNDNYSKAKDYFEQVINSGEYALKNDYGAQFIKSGEFCSESIFEINYSLMPTWDWMNMLVNTGNPDPVFMTVRGQGSMDAIDGWGFVPVQSDLVDLFVSEQDAVRMKATIVFCDSLIQQGATIGQDNYQYTGFYSNKTTKRANEQSSDYYNNESNDRIIRYSDVLLMYAEACLHTGDNMNALSAVNMVRSRAQLPALTDINIDVIMKERVLELSLEGHRFFDLVRNMQASTVLAGKGFVSNKSEFLPVPSSVLDKYPNLVQNPGY